MVSNNCFGTRFSENVGKAAVSMGTAGEADNTHTRFNRSAHTMDGIFNNN